MVKPEVGSANCQELLAEVKHMVLDALTDIQFPALFAADTVECYISFTNATESEISDSQWVGQVLVA